MSLADRTVRPGRAVLGVAVILVFTGTCGIGNGISGLSSQEAAQPLRLLPLGDSPDVAEASAAMQEAMARARLEAPLRRPLDAVNIALSAMLVVGGLMLFTRRGGAPWWISQAAAANALWTLAYAGSHVAQLFASRRELEGVFARYREAVEREAQVQAFDLPVDDLALSVAMRVGMALVWVALYGWIVWRVRRPDLRAALEPP